MQTKDKGKKESSLANSPEPEKPEKSAGEMTTEAEMEPTSPTKSEKSVEKPEEQEERTPAPDMTADREEKVEETQAAPLFRRKKKLNDDIDQPGDDVEQPDDAVEQPADAVGEPADAVGEPADAVGEPEKPPEEPDVQPEEVGDGYGSDEELQLPPEELPAEPPEEVGGKGEEEPAEATVPAGRTGLTPLGERTRAHVEQQVLRDPEMRDLTPEEAYAEVEGSEDVDYDLRETCREITKLLHQVNSSKTAIGQYVIERYYPPLQVTRRGHIYWHHKPLPRFRELIKFPEFPMSKSELQDCVALALQKRSLDEINQGDRGYADHLTDSQLILLTRVKDLSDKGAVIKELKKNPKKYSETKEWMRAKGYLKAAKPVDQTKKLIDTFERMVQSAEESLPTLEDADPLQIGFNLLTGWRGRLEVVVGILKELEGEQAKAA
jgi:hypothetical protein